MDISPVKIKETMDDYPVERAVLQWPLQKGGGKMDVRQRVWPKILSTLRWKEKLNEQARNAWVECAVGRRGASVREEQPCHG
jgi:hypothetical protein